MSHCNKWRFNKYKCTEAKHLVNPTCSAESADYTVGCSSKAYPYHQVIEEISSCGDNNLFVSIIKKILVLEKRRREIYSLFAADKNKYFVYAKSNGK